MIDKNDVDNFLDELIKVNENSTGPTLSEFCGEFTKDKDNSIYLFRYSYCSAWNSDITMYSKELTTENVRKFLMMLPPFKENWETEYETKFMDQIDLYNVDDENFILKDYEDEQLFLKIEDHEDENHWCFVKKVDML